MEDGNDILIEDDIVKATSFNVGIFGTSAVLVDSDDLFGKRALEKMDFKINTESGETHEECWREYFGQGTKSSNFSDPEIIHQDKLLRYENNDLFVSVVSTFESAKIALWLK